MAKWVLGDFCEGETATPKYSKLSEKIRHKTAGSYQCRLFCGGANCKYETSARWKKDDMAVEGIFSHWVTEKILATARPNTTLIRKCGLIQRFHKQGIKSIINLQEVNEHANCGPPLEPSGFSYNPQEFMDADIFFYNFGWKDFGVPTMNCVFDMVKVVDFALQEGKVAIHCHAGLGRTGVVIACYLVYALRVSADQAILHIRSRRPNSVQTRGQMQIVRSFAEHIRPMWVVFPASSKKSDRFTLAQYLKQQRAILHGMEARKYKRLPKIIHMLCKQLIKLSKTQRRRNWSDWTASVTSADSGRLTRNWSGGSLASDTQRCPSPGELSVTSELGRLSLSGHSPTSDSCNARRMTPSGHSPTSDSRSGRRMTPSRAFHKELSYSTIAEDIDIASVGGSVVQTVGHSASGYVTVDDLSVGEKCKWESSKHKRRFSAVPFQTYEKAVSGYLEPLVMSPVHSHTSDDFLLSVQVPSLSPHKLQPIGRSSSSSSVDGFGSIGKSSWSSCSSSRKNSSESCQVASGTTDSAVSVSPRLQLDSYSSVVEAMLLDEYDDCVLKKANKLKKHVNANTDWNCLFMEQDPCVLVVMLKTWLQSLLEPALLSDTVERVKTRLCDVNVTHKDLLLVFDKPQQLLIQTLTDMLTEMLEGQPVQMEELLHVFAEMLLTVEGDSTVGAIGESLAGLRSRRGSVQTLITMANRLLGRGNSTIPDVPQKYTNHDPGLSSLDVMVTVLARIMKEEMNSLDETIAVNSVTSRTVPSVPLADGLTQSKQVSCPVKLSSMESEHELLNRNVSGSALVKKPLPPIGEMIDSGMANCD